MFVLYSNRFPLSDPIYHRIFTNFTEHAMFLVLVNCDHNKTNDIQTEKPLLTHQDHPLQIFKGTHLQNNADSQISAMAYFDLILRSVTDPGLLNIFVRFLLDAEKFDGQRMLDVLVERISSVDARVYIFVFQKFASNLYCIFNF